MSGKPVVLRESARSDIDDAVGHYLTESGASVAYDFIGALEERFRRIGESPVSGSPRYAHEVDIPGLRFIAAGKFPCLVFCVEREAEIDVWRVLHEARDISAWLRAPCKG